MQMMKTWTKISLKKIIVSQFLCKKHKTGVWWVLVWPWRNFGSKIRCFCYIQTAWKLSIILEMVFCYQNCSDLLWEKIVLVIEKNFWNSRLKVENLQNFWDHLNNLFKQSKARTISGHRMLFWLVPGGFSNQNLLVV